ncbi:MAG: hypothetical protein AAF941_05140 [Pseudomonadota bacterium]
MRKALIAGTFLLAACKPPATDADLDRPLPEAEPTFASAPLPSPDTKGAVWAQSAEPQRIIYGIPGEEQLMALACVGDEKNRKLRITRNSPADEGAGAFLALVGNGHIGRLEVDATEVSGRSIWLGEIAAEDNDWEPLAGPRQLTATIPGAGMVTLNPSPLPMQLVAQCRNSEPAE